MIELFIFLNLVTLFYSFIRMCTFKDAFTDYSVISALVKADPCVSHQVLKEETWRSVANVWTSGMTIMCDGALSSGWYRIESSAGEDAISYCPNLDSCGTHGPIWLNGKMMYREVNNILIDRAYYVQR